MRPLLAPFAFAFALTPAALLLAPAEAAACSCIQPAGPVEYARDVDAVFVGKVTATTPTQGAGGLGGTMPGNLVTLAVERTFKGQLDAEVNIATADNSAACGINFGKPGAQWLVYARRDDAGQLHANLCSRTTTLEHAADDIAALEAAGDLGAEQPTAEGGEAAAPGPADPEPEPIDPNAGGPGAGEPGELPADGGPEPSKRGNRCAVVAEPAGGSAPVLALCLLVLGGLGLRRRRRD